MCNDPMCDFAGFCACPSHNIELTIMEPYWDSPIVQRVSRVEDRTTHRLSSRDTLSTERYLYITHLDGQKERFRVFDTMTVTVEAKEIKREDEGPDDYDYAESQMCTDPNWMND